MQLAEKVTQAGASVEVNSNRFACTHGRQWLSCLASIHRTRRWERVGGGKGEGGGGGGGLCVEGKEVEPPTCSVTCRMMVTLRGGAGTSE